MTVMDKEAQRKIDRAFVAKSRAKRIQSGRVFVHLDLPAEFVEKCDQLKQERRVVGRSVIIEEALKEYLSKHQGA